MLTADVAHVYDAAMRVPTYPATAAYVPVSVAIERLVSKGGPRVGSNAIRRWAKAGLIRSRRASTSGYYLICVEDIDELAREAQADLAPAPAGAVTA